MTFKTAITKLQILLFPLGLTLLLGTSQAHADEQGKKVFEDSCASCHSGGLKGWITDSPDINKAEDWAPFFGKGLEKMLQITIEGGEGMKPMGGCETCTNEDLRAAIQYIIDQTKTTG